MNKLLISALVLVLAFSMTASLSTLAQNHPFSITPLAEFNEPWALAFLPDGQALVTEKAGRLFLVDQNGTKNEISGIPEVDYLGQGGLGDITLHPDFANNMMVYFSYVEAGANDTRGAVVARGTLNLARAAIENSEVIWRSFPKVDAGFHYSYRIIFDDEGYMFVSSGDRGKEAPAQDLNSSLGKILRLNDDGSPAADNPFAAMGGIAAEVWSYGHRNPLGLDFDEQGQLWNIEMGPRGGDELNRVNPGANYGWPLVSNGNHYNGNSIPNHDTDDSFEKPQTWWNPSISPASFIFYTGTAFPEWHGNALITGLSSQSLVRVVVSNEASVEAERFNMRSRIRSIEQDAAGHLWILEDGTSGRLLKLSPR